MIDANALNNKVDALCALLGQRLRLRGVSFSSRLARAGRQLPRHLRQTGQVIVTAQRQAEHPRLALLVDPAPVEAALADFTRYLKQIDSAERRKTRLIRWLAGLVLNLIVITMAVVLILRWRGMI